MSLNHTPEQEVIEIVEPLSQDSLQIPQQTQQNLTPKHQHKHIEEEEHTSRTQTQLKTIKQSLKSEFKIADKKRKKIILYKCKICKTTGKKSTVKMCSKCKFHFHIQCLDPDKIIDQSKAFICQLCDKESTTTIAINHSDHKSKAQQKIPSKEVQMSKFTFQNSQEKQRSSCGFLNVSKLNTIYHTNFKKQEWKRRLYQFYIKYPYCFQNNKIFFPIEDHLLHIYQSILPSYCKTTTPRPIPKFPNNDGVPYKYYNELMEIQAFFFHFWEDLKAQSFLHPLNKAANKQIQLHEMKRKNLYEKFSVQGVTQLYAWILETLLRMYLNDIMERNRIDNMKFISSNPFFNLLTIINQEEKGLSRQIIIKIAPEIIKNLTKAPSFRHSFYSDYQVQQHNHCQLQYPKHLSCENKIKVITKLIRGLCDTDCFKEIVIKKSQQISMLTKEKGETLQKLKSIQNENIPLKEKIRESESELKQLAFSDPKQYSKKYEPFNKMLQKLILTHKLNLQKIQQYREQLKEIARKMPFVNSAIKFLGVDRFRSEYFFYRIDKGRIYVKFRQSFLCESKVGQGYLCYESKDQVERLKAWLNGKGVNEKGLLFNINNLEQKQLLDLSTHNKSEITINNQEQKRLYELESITRQDNLETLIYCENLYKQTILNSEILAERDKEMQMLFQNLQFFGSVFVSEENKVKSSITSQQLQHSHPLRAIFSKYTSKILNWNEKVKRFWHQFLDIYTSSPLQQTQTNLLIIVTIWKISMSLYHNQIIKKREKTERRKERMLQSLRKQGLGNNPLPGDEDEQEQHRIDHQQLTSQLEQNSTPQSEQNYGGIGKRLRKRQSRMKIDTIQSPTPQQSQLAYTSNKNQTSDLQQSDQQLQLSQDIILKLEKNKKGNKKSKHKHDEVKNEVTKEKTKKSNKSKNKPNDIQESKAPSSYESQQQSKLTQKQEQQNQLLLQYDQSQLNSPEEFCEECFENVNYNSTTKAKVVKCEVCFKVYHKKCLDEDDTLRLKTYKNDEWKCVDCQNQAEKQQENIKNSKKLINNKLQSEKPQQIILETSKVTLRNESQTTKTNKKKIKPNNQQKLEPKKSKATQKKQKKQRKKKENKSYSQEVNSQSLEKQNEKEEQQYVQPKASKTGRTKANNIKKKTVGQKSTAKKSQANSNKSSIDNMNTSKSLQIEKRSTRDKKSRKKIIQPSSQEQQPNSEEQSQQCSDQQIV